ncbi:MAG: Spy/CpxP family protein refolding chaperone [Candidatus Rokuibacteriota bacterium]
MIRNRWTRALIVMVGGVLLLAAGEASARDRMERLKEHLDLTDAQVTAIREVLSEDWPAHRQVFQSLRQVQGELRQLALNGAEDAALQQKTAEIAELLAQTLQLRVQRLQRIATILTPEQRVKFAELPEGRPRMMKGGARGHS